MDWTQGANFAEFDFSNLEVPMPLKELLLDEEIATLAGVDSYDSALWMPMPEQQGFENVPAAQQPVMDSSENSLWNFMTGYSTSGENQYTQ